MRATLVSALCSCVADPKRRWARRFLQGLSSDELQYIAEFLGSCILESQRKAACTRWELAQDITQFERCRRAAQTTPARIPAPAESGALQDDEHKMILLLEYLCRCGLTQHSMALTSGQMG